PVSSAGGVVAYGSVAGVPVSTGAVVVDSGAVMGACACSGLVVCWSQAPKPTQINSAPSPCFQLMGFIGFSAFSRANSLGVDSAISVPRAATPSLRALRERSSRHAPPVRARSSKNLQDRQIFHADDLPTAANTQR